MNGDRIINAIETAGGVTEKADLNRVNLAFVLSDGCKIRIPSIEDVNENLVIISNSSGEGIVSENENSKNGGKININTASQSELESLTGIGPSISSKIIEYRIKNGKSSKIEDLKNVSGIGVEKYNSIKEKISVK